MRILAASLWGPGHAHPMLAVAQRLAERGHDVTFMSGTQHVDDAARAGCDFVAMPMVFGSTFDKLRPYEDSELLARACIDPVEQITPDAVIADLLTFGPALAAEVAGVPWASLVIHGLHAPSEDLLPFGIGRAPHRGLGRLGDRLIKRFYHRDVSRARDVVNEVRARLGLTPVHDRLDVQLSSELILVATLPCLELPRSDWPARAHVIGPCLWGAGGEDPRDPAGDGPLVLIAASTAHDARPMLDAAVAAVTALGARAVVTTGKAEVGSEHDARFAFHPFVSHDAVMPRCAAVVCSGGHGVVARALTHGAPLVIVPGHGDQRENAYRVQRAGAGLKATPATLQAALAQVLRSERFHAAAAAAKAEAAGLDGPGAAAALVEVMAGRSLEPGATVTDG